MSVSNITAIQHHTSLAKTERINRINANNREISALENQIAGQKEVSAATKELIANNSKSINLTKEIITDTKKLIDIKKEMISNNEALISSGNRKIDILEQLKASSDRLIGVHQEQRGLLQESRDLTKESRDLTQKMLEVQEKLIETMKRLMTINPAKYGSLENPELQKQPEVIAAKNQVVSIGSVKVEQYPKEEHVALTDTVKKVVEATFSEIKATDIKANRELFINLPKRIEEALDKKHESLSVKDIKQIITDHYKSVEQFSRIKKLDYLDLALKDIKL